MSDQGQVSQPSSQPSAPASSAPSSSPASTPNEGNNLGVPNMAGSPTAAPSSAKEQPQQSQPTAQQQQQQAKIEEAVRKFKLKIDGVEQELPESEVIRRAQQWSASDKRFQEAAQIRKQHEEINKSLKETPMEALIRVHGPEKARELTEKWLYDQLKYDQLSPEQKRMREVEQELQKYKEKEKADEETKKAEVQRAEEEKKVRLSNQYRETYQKQIVDTLQTSGLPVNEETVARMAFYMQQNLKNGYDAPMDQIVEQVRTHYVSSIKKLLGSSDGDGLIKILGDDIATKLRQADLARLKAEQPQVPSKPPETPISTNTPSKSQEKRYKTMDEARAEIQRRLNS